MMKFEDISIKNKILLGIGSSFLIVMIVLLTISIYQFRGMSEEVEDFLADNLLEQKQNKYKSLVQTRAKMLAEVYQNNKGELSQSELEALFASLNREADLEDNYFYIYDMDGKTISLPPEPELEGKNRWELEVEDMMLIQEIVSVAKTGGGKIDYPYTNPVTGEIEMKYSYVEPISGTDFLVGSGGYETEFQSLLNTVVHRLNTMRDETLFGFIVVFLIAVALVFVVIINISNYFTDSINLVLNAFNKIGQGKLDYRLKSERKDEFGKLFIGFNYMIEKIGELTYNDPLTGLPNMNFLRMNLSSDLSKLNNQQDHLYLFTLGIANLNSINSNYGYKKGNWLLKQIYNRLNKIVEEKIIIARKNNEFVFYIKTDSKREYIYELAEDIIEQLTNPYNIEDDLVYANPKLGIAISQAGKESCDDLIKKSKLALHFVNKNEVNILFYNVEMQGELTNRINLEQQMRLAIKKEEFLLYFQPILDIDKNKTVKLEALIRWNHPEQGMISPGKFIPLAEDTGMIIELGEWVLQEACSKLKSLHQAGYDDLSIAVNIAPQEFQEVDFVDKVRNILNNTGLAGEYLELEITERTLIKDMDYTLEVLKRLKKLGVEIAIDDFGTGYSSLGYLNKLSLDALKIDKRFIQDEKNQGIVKTIITIGSNLNLKVVAEGVERESELEFLRDNDCDLYQGYLFSKPLAFGRINDLLVEEK